MYRRGEGLLFRFSSLLSNLFRLARREISTSFADDPLLSSTGALPEPEDPRVRAVVALGLWSFGLGLVGLFLVIVGIFVLS